MKVIPVKDRKGYEAANGEIFSKKHQAEKINIMEARAVALAQLIAKHMTMQEAACLTIDDFIRFIAEHGDEVIEALTEE